jgi:uncharacterized DUF497 family protein
VSKFEWDALKAASNVRKHRVSFDEAVTVFADGMALTFADTDHYESEDRSRTYGLSNKGRLLVVVHTERRNTVRIISARKATRYEKDIYEKG